MIVEGDSICELVANTLQGYLNHADSCFLHLYTNDPTLSPGLEDPGLFVQANYPSYAPFGVAGIWPAPARDEAGKWILQAGPFPFATNTGTAPVACVGWFIQLGDKVVFSERFASPLVAVPGLPGPSLLIRLLQGAQSAVCVCPNGQ